jgi:hypothetical protein
MRMCLVLGLSTPARESTLHSHTRMYAHTHVCTHARMHTRTYAHTRTHAHTPTHTHVHTVISPGQHQRAFRRARVDGPMLTRLNHAVLQGMGILDPRKQDTILNRISRFQRASSSDLSTPTSPTPDTDGAWSTAQSETRLLEGQNIFACENQQLRKVPWVLVSLFESIACGNFGTFVPPPARACVCLYICVLPASDCSLPRRGSPSPVALPCKRRHGSGATAAGRVEGDERPGGHERASSFPSGNRNTQSIAAPQHHPCVCVCVCMYVCVCMCVCVCVCVCMYVCVCM